MAQILVIAAHPHMEHSRITRSLLHAAAAAGARVAVRDLYALYPDYFIDVAADALLPGGALWLVANAHLPYETSLASRFDAVRVVASARGYKVIEARAARR